MSTPDEFDSAEIEVAELNRNRKIERNKHARGRAG